MPTVSILFGLALVLLGLDGYLDRIGLVRPDTTHSPTSLIPAIFGALLIVCGLIGLKESRLKHAMHAAAMVGLVGMLAGAGMGLPKLFGAEPLKPAARSQIWLGAVCAVFVALCVNSFIAARRRRAAAGAIRSAT